MDKAGIKKILLVCTGNSCRSIMAEGYFRKRLKEAGKDISVISAGTDAFEGMPSSGEGVEILKELEVDIAGHKAACLTQDMVKDSDIILVMNHRHKERVVSLEASAEDKTFLLREFDGATEEIEIPDPIGRGIVFYRNVFDVIKNSTEGFLKWLED